MKDMYRFSVKGGVKKYGNPVGHYEKETIAPTKAKAKSNAMAQIKRDLHLTYNTKLTWDKNVVVTRLD